MPGVAMALARLNVPGSCSTAGRSCPGAAGEDVTIQEVFEAVGANAAGNITDQDLVDLENLASPGAGACGGQFTANTMGMAFESSACPRWAQHGARRERRKARSPTRPAGS